MTSARRRITALALGATLVFTGVSCSKDKSPTLSADTTVFESSTTTGALPRTDSPPTTRPIGDLDTIVKPKADGKLAVYTVPDDATQPAQQLDNPWLYNNEKNAKVPRVLLARDERPGWVEVYLPQRPNGSTGWVKASEVTTEPMNYRIEVHMGDFNLKAFKDGQVVLDTKIAVGTSDNPTPGGVYFTSVLIQPPNPNGDYGPYAWGLSGYSETLASFNGGDGQLGIHGTNKPNLLGTNVSHGCIRVANADINKMVNELFRDQPLGIPVQVFA